MDNKARKKDILKSIKLIGWIETHHRIKTIEDRQLFDEIQDEDTTKQKEIIDKKLKRSGISF